MSLVLYKNGRCCRKVNSCVIVNKRTKEKEGETYTQMKRKRSQCIIFVGSQSNFRACFSSPFLSYMITRNVIIGFLHETMTRTAYVTTVLLNLICQRRKLNSDSGHHCFLENEKYLMMCRCEDFKSLTAMLLNLICQNQ